MKLLMVVMLFALAIGSVQAIDYTDYEGDFWVEGHYAVQGDPELTRLCGLMQRRNQVNLESYSTFDYQIIWYTDGAPIVRQGTGVISQLNRDIDWADSITTFPEDQLYLRGEGARLTSTSLYWTGKFWDAQEGVGMRSTQFWVVPLNPGDVEPDCN